MSGTSSAPNDNAFHPYAYPQPNMLVQQGSKVLIKGLKSVAGQKLNGKTGTAIHFFPQEGRWSVQIDDVGGFGTEEGNSAGAAAQEEERGPKKQATKKEKEDMFKIRITNLVLKQGGGESMRVCVILRDNPSWMSCSEGGRVLVRAGTIAGDPALCIFDDFRRPEFDRNRFYAEISTMGIAKEAVESLIGKYTSP